MKMESGVMELLGVARVPYTDPVAVGRGSCTGDEYEPVPPMDLTARDPLKRLFRATKAAKLLKPSI